MPAQKLTVTTLEDGRLQLSGATFVVRDQIKARGGRWDPAARVWTLPAGTSTEFEAPPPPPPPPPPPRPKPREEWTAAEWQNYCLRRRGNSGPCCQKATAYWEYDQGPTHYRCERHGVTHNSYTGD
jgi:hypothetical protein